MESYEALRKCIAGHAVKVAKRLGRSVSLVHKWCEPATDFTDSGAINDLDRVEMIIETSLKEGVQPRDAFAPIHYLAQQFDGLFLPPVPKTIRNHDISQQLCRTIKEASEAFTAAAKALEDDELTPAERREFVKEAYEAMAEFASLTRMIEEG